MHHMADINFLPNGPLDFKVPFSCPFGLHKSSHNSFNGKRHIYIYIYPVFEDFHAWHMM